MARSYSNSRHANQNHLSSDFSDFDISLRMPFDNNYRSRLADATIFISRVFGNVGYKPNLHHSVPSSCKWIVERFHRHLKSSIKAHESTQSSEILPIVLLGIRTAVKEDIKASCAELVYGTTLQVPSDMIKTSIIPPNDNIFVDRLRNTMREMNPAATSTHGKTKFYINPSLKTSSPVFLRIDSVKPPLCRPYTGPHKVLKRTENFTIELNGRTSTVSIDRVKPAYLIPTCEEKTPTLQAEKTVSPETFAVGQTSV
ncbi:hypothetical protein AVEN_17345-1 [Araneus ventricosus]|uniref:Integrase catalytic domain-containing protein n=1 Tax=Araneus ventricosus TaxID=182803 RepID=A0A4Y2PZC1_ARAVE|nr:hypothetical protein AVEN_17345-1 [Araneus ventricosus]